MLHVITGLYWHLVAAFTASTAIITTSHWHMGVSRLLKRITALFVCCCVIMPPRSPALKGRQKILQAKAKAEASSGSGGGRKNPMPPNSSQNQKAPKIDADSKTKKSKSKLKDETEAEEWPISIPEEIPCCATLNQKFGQAEQDLLPEKTVPLKWRIFNIKKICISEARLLVAFRGFSLPRPSNF